MKLKAYQLKINLERGGFDLAAAPYLRPVWLAKDTDNGYSRRRAGFVQVNPENATVTQFFKLEEIAFVPVDAEQENDEHAIYDDYFMLRQ